MRKREASAHIYYDTSTFDNGWLTFPIISFVISVCTFCLVVLVISLIKYQNARDQQQSLRRDIMSTTAPLTSIILMFLSLFTFALTLPKASLGPFILALICILIYLVIVWQLDLTSWHNFLLSLDSCWSHQLGCCTQPSDAVFSIKQCDYDIQKETMAGLYNIQLQAARASNKVVSPSPVSHPIEATHSPKQSRSSTKKRIMLALPAILAKLKQTPPQTTVLTSPNSSVSSATPTTTPHTTNLSLSLQNQQLLTSFNVTSLGQSMLSSPNPNIALLSEQSILATLHTLLSSTSSPTRSHPVPLSVQHMCISYSLNSQHQEVLLHSLKAQQDGTLQQQQQVYEFFVISPTRNTSTSQESIFSTDKQCLVNPTNYQEKVSLRRLVVEARNAYYQALKQLDNVDNHQPQLEPLEIDRDMDTEGTPERKFIPRVTRSKKYVLSQTSQQRVATTEQPTADQLSTQASSSSRHVEESAGNLPHVTSAAPDSTTTDTPYIVAPYSYYYAPLDVCVTMMYSLHPTIVVSGQIDATFCVVANSIPMSVPSLASPLMLPLPAAPQNVSKKSISTRQVIVKPTYIFPSAFPCSVGQIFREFVQHSCEFAKDVSPAADNSRIQSLNGDPSQPFFFCPDAQAVHATNVARFSQLKSLLALSSVLTLRPISSETALPLFSLDFRLFPLDIFSCILNHASTRLAYLACLCNVVAAASCSCLPISPRFLSYVIAFYNTLRTLPQPRIQPHNLEPHAVANCLVMADPLTPRLFVCVEPQALPLAPRKSSPTIPRFQPLKLGAANKLCPPTLSFSSHSEQPDLEPNNAMDSTTPSYLTKLFLFHTEPPQTARREISNGFTPGQIPSAIGDGVNVQRAIQSSFNLYVPISPPSQTAPSDRLSSCSIDPLNKSAQLLSRSYSNQLSADADLIKQYALHQFFVLPSLSSSSSSPEYIGLESDTASLHDTQLAWEHATLLSDILMMLTTCHIAAHAQYPLSANVVTIPNMRSSPTATTALTPSLRNYSSSLLTTTRHSLHKKSLFAFVSQHMAFRFFCHHFIPQLTATSLPSSNQNSHAPSCFITTVPSNIHTELCTVLAKHAADFALPSHHHAPLSEDTTMSPIKPTQLVAPATPTHHYTLPSISPPTPPSPRLSPKLARFASDPYAQPPVLRRALLHNIIDPRGPTAHWPPLSWQQCRQDSHIVIFSLLADTIIKHFTTPFPDQCGDTLLLPGSDLTAFRHMALCTVRQVFNLLMLAQKQSTSCLLSFAGCGSIRSLLQVAQLYSFPLDAKYESNFL